MQRLSAFILQQEQGALASDELQLLMLLLLAIPSALLGIFISLRKMTMLANSLSHTILLGIVITFLLFHGEGLLTPKALLFSSFISALLTAFITESCVKLFRLQNDASIGLVFTALFSLGIILVTLFVKTHILAQKSLWATLMHCIKKIFSQLFGYSLEIFSSLLFFSKSL